MGSFFAELKRRNVFRVAVLYGIVAWLILQVSDVAVPALRLPEWTLSFVLFLLAIGFPVAIIVAWAFELTPEGLKRTREVDPDASITPVTGQKINHLIIGVLTAIFTLAVYTGLEKGIKWIGNVNMWVFVGVFGFVLIFGPTLFLINLTTNSIGQYLAEFLPLSLYTAPGVEGNWLGGWTIFYWAWWIAWGPFVGGFVARISRGRTIREYVAGTVLVPLVITIVWFNVIGGTALHAEINGTLEMYKAISADVGSGIFTLLTAYPMGMLISWVVFFNLIVFLVTSADSAAFFVAMIIGNGELNPTVGQRLTWGFFIGAISVLLLVTGGLKAVQTASIIAALPFAFVMIAMMFSVTKLLKYESEGAVVAEQTDSISSKEAEGGLGRVTSPQTSEA